MPGSVMEEVHVLPTPRIAGWTEESRQARVQSVREEFARKGGSIVKEERFFNTAFDRHPEKTTFRFTVEYPEPVE